MSRSKPKCKGARREAGPLLMLRLPLLGAAGAARAALREVQSQGSIEGDEAPVVRRDVDSIRRVRIVELAGQVVCAAYADANHVGKPVTDSDRSMAANLVVL